MGCGEVRQVRLGEMIEFKWDSSGSLVSNPLDESSNINLGAANTVAVSIAPCSVALGTGVSSVEFSFATAPINGRAFYAPVKDAGSAVEVSVSDATPVFVSAGGFSRFFQLMVPETLSGATGETTLVLTIDVVVRS